jgi:hypothetical protein
MIVRVVSHYPDLRPGDVVEVDPRTKQIKRLLAAKVLEPVKKQT